MVLYEHPKLFFNATAITDPLLIERERKRLGQERKEIRASLSIQNYLVFTHHLRKQTDQLLIKMPCVCTI